MGVDETLLSEVVRRILSVARPDRIILFGSAATGHMTKDSDIDLLVVEPTPANTHERSVAIRDAVGNIGYAVDSANCSRHVQLGLRPRWSGRYELPPECRHRCGYGWLAHPPRCGERSPIGYLRTKGRRGARFRPRPAGKNY